MMMTTRTALVGDIGGTNARFGIVHENGSLAHTQQLPCRDFKTLEDVVGTYLDQTRLNTPPAVGLLAVAGPVIDDEVTFTNLPWQTNAKKLAAHHAINDVRLMNDFAAVALSVPYIQKADLQQIGGGVERPHQNKAVIGPGTGLGVAGMTWVGDRYAVISGEGGHMSLSDNIGDRENAIFYSLGRKFGHVSAERVCSGKGLENLYNTIRQIDGRDDVPVRNAAEISGAALAGNCDVATESLDLMLGFLGRAAGNIALIHGALGGVYIAGGIPAKLGPYFAKSRFREEFENKGGKRGYLESIQTHVIVTKDSPAMLGLTHEATRLLHEPTV
jgi:glucokinase